MKKITLLIRSDNTMYINKADYTYIEQTLLRIGSDIEFDTHKIGDLIRLTASFENLFLIIFCLTCNPDIKEVILI